MPNLPIESKFWDESSDFAATHKVKQEIVCGG
jgi:hypothetical protein